jgi:dTDP-4-amino-4,6-dideoxygalactose transaminase
LYVVRTRRPEELAALLAERGVGSGRHYPFPVHLSPAYEWLGHGPGSFPVSEVLAAECLSLPVYPGMTEEQIEAVVAAIAAAFDRA